MPQKKPLSDAELAAFEAGQDFEALLVQSAREMGAGKTRKVYTPVGAARENAGLSQAGFAELLGVSVRSQATVTTTPGTPTMRDEVSAAIEVRPSAVVDRPWTDPQRDPSRAASDRWLFEKIIRPPSMIPNRTSRKIGRTSANSAIACPRDRRSRRQRSLPISCTSR